MLFEESEHEPDEYDPEAEFRDPDSDSLTIPEVPTSEADAPPELVKTFWAIVLVINAALLALSLGIMFLVFESNFETGGGLIAGGVVLLGFAVYRYRRFERQEENDSPQPTADTEHQENSTIETDQQQNFTSETEQQQSSTSETEQQQESDGENEQKGGS